MEQERFSFAREGIPFILITLGIFVISFLFASPFFWIPALLLNILVLNFFRDPPRRYRGDQRAIIAPADGKVIEISTVPATADSPLAGMKKLSIFMNIFDVHVNRAPVGGQVVYVDYRPGKFFAANVPKASPENEQNWIGIKTEEGEEVVVVQIAGLIARRISCWVEKGSNVFRGQKIGIIRFGSRVDIYVGPEAWYVAEVGQRVKAGLTVIGYFEKEAVHRAVLGA